MYKIIHKNAKSIFTQIEPSFSILPCNKLAGSKGISGTISSLFSLIYNLVSVPSSKTSARHNVFWAT